jgi:hypothetical protein
VVALRASTGQVVWHFQTTHHDVWDYDVAAQPTLATLRRDDREIPAVLVGTKMGFVFALERETGKPIFPVEERPVPMSDVPGEQLSPTQPIPLAPPPLVPQSTRPAPNLARLGVGCLTGIAVNFSIGSKSGKRHWSIRLRLCPLEADVGPLFAQQP